MTLYWVLRYQPDVMIGYADDTLMLAKGQDWEDVIRTANHATACVTRAIRKAGLKVAPEKTEAAFYHDGTQGTPPSERSIIVESVNVPIKEGVKYLGLFIDSTWGFREHFSRLIPRLEKTATVLSRIMPNIGGPRAGARRMYAAVVQSIALYGAPIWAQEMCMDRQIKKMIHRAQRTMAIRVSRCYRTVSFRAATLLAGTPPLEYVARAHQESYKRVKILRRRVGPQNVAKREVAIIRRQCKQQAVVNWRRELAEETSTGKRVSEALVPHLEEWLEQRNGGITFHMAQVLTGHDCFGEYLRKIGKEVTAQCHHCPEEDREMDTADHTLMRCSAWEKERGSLKERIGDEISLPIIIGKIIREEEAWKAFATFCGQVMRRKEDAERVRRGEQPPPPPPLPPQSPPPGEDTQTHKRSMRKKRGAILRR